VSVKIRTLASANRRMQRLGFLKLLCAQTARVETSNLESVGKQFVQTLMKRVRLTPPYADTLREYVRLRLTDKVYHDLRKSVLDNSPRSNGASLEIQDVYLSDPDLPSTTGKLVEADWKKYPYLGTCLDLIKPGTYSLMTRALVLLAVTSKDEIAAFGAYNKDINPLRVSPEQVAVLLYCFIDNDAEIIHRLFHGLLELRESAFDERKAGDMLPQIIRDSVNSFRAAALPGDDRERLSALDKIARSIEEWRGKPYTGSGAREEFVRVRLEPYCDLGLFTKPDKHRFVYRSTPALQTLMNTWQDQESTDDFLETRFFATLAGMYQYKVQEAEEDEARQALIQAGHELKSTLNYSPITDTGLLAGIHLLFRNRRILELSRTRTLLRAWQKEAPNVVRFTVDRMGALAYVKFVQPTLPVGSEKAL